MVPIRWSIEKNRLLKADDVRRACFEDVVASIESGGLLDDIEHPNQLRYPHQRMLVVLFDGYVYAVPYVQNENGGLFLKIVFPSRALKRLYIGDDDHG